MTATFLEQKKKKEGSHTKGHRFLRCRFVAHTQGSRFPNEQA